MLTTIGPPLLSSEKSSLLNGQPCLIETRLPKRTSGQLPAIPKLLQVGSDSGLELRGFFRLLAQRRRHVRRGDSRHRFLLGARGAASETSASSASISSTVGKLPLRLSGSVSTIFVSHSATPIGLAISRNAYSTTILFFERQSKRPIVGLSSGWRRRSSAAER